LSNSNFYDKLKNIKALLFDMDGVLTDGTVIVMPGDELIRKMHTRDGSALARAVKQGYQVGIISAGFSQSAIDRFVKFGIQHVHMNARPKLPIYNEILEKTGLKREEILYMGDDIADMQCLHISGIGVCPKDSCQDVFGVADYVTEKPGGYGAVREVIEMVLRAQDKWELPDLNV
jgi:3-deoxy-D-manno-octulosonate 8-phosphate phosphatase (KDO 8-P phosphatase)